MSLGSATATWSHHKRETRINPESTASIIIELNISKGPSRIAQLIIKSIYYYTYGLRYDMDD